MANVVKPADKKRTMLSAFKTKMRCALCNDTVSRYVDLVSDVTESWFCNEPKCKHGIFHRTTGAAKPEWVKESGAGVDVKEVVKK